MKETVRFAVTPEEAGLLVAARASEAADGPEASAAADARLIAGKDPKEKALARAKLVLSRRSLKPSRVPTLPTGLFTGALMLCAYFLGVMTDRFSSEGAVVNLLSPALLLILFWQIALYALLLVGTIAAPLGWKPKWPGRELFAALLSRLRILTVSKQTLRERPLWLSLLAPALRSEAARAFHLAAASLGAGLLTGLAFRGIGTAYTVGWTSTWLAGHEAWLAALFSATYGLVPLELFGIPFPDAAAIAEMNLRINAQGSPDAAAWLLRLMGLVAIVVILPRLLLAFFACRRAKAARTRFVWIDEQDEPAPVSTQRFVASISEGATVLTTVPAGESLRRRTAALLMQPDARWRTVDVWKDEPESALASVDTEAAVLLFDATATPEEEVHGHWIDAVGRRQPDAVTLLVDLSGLEAQFGAESERLTARKALWESFAAEHHAALRFLRLQ
ncbi:MAG TPA: DUF2868 domain-containing protein [Candidatus Sutterella merdavium]|nr:DUF2868 domain-containing protein [Candidatus Sutterella merdavium]